MADEISITVNIGGRPYRLKVSRNEEEIVRKAAKIIDDQISQFAGNYRHNDKQDLLAMSALHFATNALNVEDEKKFISEDMEPILNKVDSLLDEVLKD